LYRPRSPSPHEGGHVRVQAVPTRTQPALRSLQRAREIQAMEGPQRGGGWQKYQAPPVPLPDGKKVRASLAKGVIPGIFVIAAL